MIKGLEHWAHHGYHVLGHDPDSYLAARAIVHSSFQIPFRNRKRSSSTWRLFQPFALYVQRHHHHPFPFLFRKNRSLSVPPSNRSLHLQITPRTLFLLITTVRTRPFSPFFSSILLWFFIFFFCPFQLLFHALSISFFVFPLSLSLGYEEIALHSFREIL